MISKYLTFTKEHRRQARRFLNSFGTLSIFFPIESCVLFSLHDKTCARPNPFSEFGCFFNMAASVSKKALNFNIGVLGHIDSGKTSLAKALSSTASTASFDKNPQSKERGITLDLGFSSFQVAMPEHLKHHRYDLLQFTLVDCPGHASLIRTIIGGAQIIDMMMLVVDVTKGVQTQTAECLVIGEILCEKMVVVLNKIDLRKEEKRDALIEKVN